MIEHLRIIASCFYLWILRSFSEHIFYRAPLRNCLFHVQVAEFQPAHTIKILFVGAFQAFFTRTRSSHLKAFIYLKSLKTICEEVSLGWSCEMPTWKFTKRNSFTHLLQVFCVHFLRTHHDYFFRRGFESVQAKLILESRSKK